MTTMQAGGAVRDTRQRSGERPGGGFPLRGVDIAALALLGLTFAGLFFRWFQRQHLLSWHSLEDWGHAYAVPLISGFLVWRERKRLSTLPVETFWPGLVPVLFGVMSYFFGVVGVHNHMFQGLSLVVTIFGVVLLLTGPRITGAVFPAIAYLAMGITISERIMLEITWPLQQLASQGAWVMLSVIGAVFGFSVDVAGTTLTVIDSAGDEHPLNVAQACSGMRMVVAFIALGGAVALFACKQWWQRVLLLLLAVPVALLMNVVRVSVLGVLTIVDPNLAAGEAHTFIGTLLLFPSLGLFLLVVWSLNKIISEPETPPAPEPTAGSSPLRLMKISGVVLVVLFGASALGFERAISVYGIHLRKSPVPPPDGRLFTSLPTETENWIRVGNDRLESAEIVDELGTRNYITRRYVKKDSRGTDEPIVIELHAAYYTGQIDTVPHVPERCFVGGGLQIGSRAVELPLDLDDGSWQLDESVPEAYLGRTYTVRTSNRYSEARGARVRLPFDPQGLKLRVTEFSTAQGDSFYAGYFFIANGSHVASSEGVRLLAFNLEDDYAYYSKIQLQSFDAESAEELAQWATELLRDLMGDIMLCLPDWIEVVEGRYPPERSDGGSNEG